MTNGDRTSAATAKAVDPIPESMKRDAEPIPVAIYVRVSSDRQDVANSIAAQIDEITRYAKAHNMVVVEIYKDEAMSGKVTARPGFQKMIVDAQDPDAPFKTILVWSYSRFSRNQMDSVVYPAKLEQQGVQLISITEPVDNSPTGRLIRSVIQSIDVFYSDNLSEQVRRGLRSLIRRGFYPHKDAPYGYMLERVKDGEVEHNRLIPDPTTAKIVRRIILESGAGHSDTDLAGGLTADGIPTPSGKAEWAPSSIDAIANRKLYAGWVIWGVNSTSGEEPMEEPNCHEAIVTLEEWELAQKSRASREKKSTHPRRAGSKRLMSDLLVCVNCDEILQVRPSQDPSECSYTCKIRRHSPEDCECPILKSRDYEPRFLRAVVEDILSPRNIAAATEIISEELKIPYQEKQAAMDLIEKELTKLERREDRIKTAFEDETYDSEEYKRRMTPVRERKAELKAKQSEVRTEMGRDAAIVADPQGVLDFAQNMTKLLRHASPKEARQLLQRFIKCVWVEPGRTIIEYRIPLPNDGPNPGATRRELALRDGEPVSVRPTAQSSPRPRKLNTLGSPRHPASPTPISQP